MSPARSARYILLPTETRARKFGAVASRRPNRKIGRTELARRCWGSIDMRSVLTALLGPLRAFLPNVAIAQNAQILTGSGVVIGAHGEILTNAHVVERCNTISVQFSSEQAQPAVLVADDQRNDLAVIRSKNPRVSVAAFREGKPLRAGDAVVALGYPLSGLLASAANVSTGNVSALAGIG